jgi:hypothetical protein
LPDEEARAEVERLDEIFATLGEGGGPSSKARRKESLDDLAVVDLRQDIRLKKTYAERLVRLMTGQVIFTNLVFVVYAAAGPGWDVPAEVMIAWLGSTVVELVGVTAIVTRYLFPPRDAA